jgi:hypothetical protein
MRRGGWLVLLIGVVAVSLAHAQGKSSSSGRGARLDAVTLLIRHRVFHDFRDVQRVKLKQDFIVGDTDFSARVVQYVPDFAMDLGSRKIFSRTDQPNNPAFKIIVFKNKVPQDTTWALLNMPPHFARKSLFGFLVARIDFHGRAPVVRDSTAAGATPPVRPATGGPPPAPAQGDSASHR